MAKITVQNPSSLSGFKNAAKVIVGTLLMTIFPKRRHRMERLATIPWHDDEQPDAIDRLIRKALLWQSSLDSSGNKLADLHKNFWSMQSADTYYAGTKTRFERVFVPNFDHFLDQLAIELKKYDIHTVVEIGCGDGQLLRHMEKRLEAKQLIGLDLSVDQITQNTAANTSDTIEFHSGDAQAWIADNASSHTAFVTCLGVLEYFTQAQLQSLLQQISGNHAPAVSLFIEPIDAAADFSTFDDSYVAGEEHSFTHNYPQRLSEANWEVLANQEVQVGNYRWLVFLASCP